MKFSKSILIFLVFSSVSGAFHYAFQRTNGNLFKSLQFALFFVANQLGWMELRLPPTQDQDQLTRQPVSSLVSNPYVSVFDDYRPSSLGIDPIERSPSVPHYSQTQTVINELRAGYSRAKGSGNLTHHHLDVATAQHRLPAGKTNTKAATSSILWRDFNFFTQESFFDVESTRYLSANGTTIRHASARVYCLDEGTKKKFAGFERRVY